MEISWQYRSCSAILRFLAVVVLISLSASPARADEGGLGGGLAGGLVGRLIVAAPEMPENPFSRTVILMIDHDANGGYGLVLNRALATGGLGDVLRDMGAAEKFSDRVRASEASIRIMSGGPVEQAVAFLLHGGPPAETDVKVAPGLSLARDLSELERLVSLPDAPPMLLALGYSGWGPGQLEREFARGDWHLLFPDRGLLLETPTVRMWSAAMAKLPKDL